MMKPLERVALALQNKEADRVPVYPIVSGVTRKLIGATYKEWATNAEVTAKALIKVTEDYGLDTICTLTDLSVEAEDFGQKLTYPENEAAHPDFDDQLLKDVKDYAKVKAIDPTKSPRMSEHIKLCDILVKEKGQDYPIVAFTFAPLGLLSMLRGQANLYMDLIMHPDEVKAALEPITETYIKYFDALIDTGVHAIMMDTLFASKTIMSKQMWMEFEGHLVERLAKHIHNRGCMVMIHNCGHGIYFDVQIETMKPEAISFCHLPDDCKTMEEVKEKYGKVTTLIGHVDPTMVVTASLDDIEAECKKQIDAYKKDGGFILATGCEFPANATLEAAELMVRVANEYGKYEDLETDKSA